MAHCVEKILRGAAVDFFRLPLIHEPWWIFFSPFVMTFARVATRESQEVVRFGQHLKIKVLIRCSIRFSSHAVNSAMPAACARVNRIEFTMSGIASSVPLVRCVVQRLNSKWVVLFASETHPFFRFHLGLVAYVGGSELRPNENYTYNCRKHVDRINWRRALTDEEMRKRRLHFRH